MSFSSISRMVETIQLKLSLHIDLYQITVFVSWQSKKTSLQCYRNVLGIKLKLLGHVGIELNQKILFTSVLSKRWICNISVRAKGIKLRVSWYVKRNVEFKERHCVHSGCQKDMSSIS